MEGITGDLIEQSFSPKGTVQYVDDRVVTQIPAVLNDGECAMEDEQTDSSIADHMYSAVEKEKEHDHDKQVVNHDGEELNNTDNNESQNEKQNLSGDDNDDCIRGESDQKSENVNSSINDKNEGGISSSEMECDSVNPEKETVTNGTDVGNDADKETVTNGDHDGNDVEMAAVSESRSAGSDDESNVETNAEGQNTLNEDKLKEYDSTDDASESGAAPNSDTLGVNDGESVTEGNQVQTDEDTLDSAGPNENQLNSVAIDTQTELDEPDGIVINESDILKSVDEYGRGKRPKIEKKDMFSTSMDEDEGGYVKRSPAGGRKGKSPAKRLICRAPINHDLLQVAYDMGWRRELVIRNTFEAYTPAGNPKKTPADVYYRSPPPNSKKLRSLKEVIKFLKDTRSPLTVENFSFLRESVSEPPWEYVRHAGSRGTTLTPSSSKKPEVVIERDGVETALDDSMDTAEDSPEIDTPRPVVQRAKFAKIKHTPIGRLDSKKLVFVKSLSNKSGIQNKTNTFASSKVIRVQGTVRPKVETLIMHDPMIPPDMSLLNDQLNGDDDDDAVKEPPAKKYKATARKSTTPRLKPPIMVSGQPEYHGTEALCTLHCPGQENIPPSLHCNVCLCLFHPQCVAFTDNNTDKDFVCLRCVNVSSANPTRPTNSVKTVSEPLKSEPVSSISTSSVLPLVKVKQEPVDTGYETQQSFSTESSKSASVSHQEANPVLLEQLRSSILDKQVTSVPNVQNLLAGFPLTTTAPSPKITYSLHNSTSAADNSRTNANSPRTLPLLVGPGLLNPMLGSTSLITSTGSNMGTPNRYLFMNTGASFPVGNLPLTVPHDISVPKNTNLNGSTQPPSLTTAIFPPKLKAAPKLPTPVIMSSPNNVLPNQLPNGLLPESTKPSPPKTGQILTLPAAVTKRLNIQQPLALKINNMQITVPPSSFISTADGLKVFLPPKTFPVSLGETAQLSVTVTNEKVANTGSDVSVSIKTSTSEDLKVSSVSDSGSVKTSPRKGRRWKAGINPSMCMIKKLYGGFDCMFTIFQYLNIKDLLNVGLVCKTWRQISMHPSLWQEVKFRNMKVPNWESAVGYLSARTVKAINLKGLLHGEDRNRTWHSLVPVLHKLSSIQCLHFGLVPASVLHAVCEKMPNLETLTAEWISDYTNNQMWTVPTKIDVGKFSSLKNLQELKLRGVGGLALPSFSLSADISQIASLTKLTSLSLTSLKEAPDSEFGFLSEMTNLQTLELGDCSLWSSETYFQLSRLSKLKSLRLDCGGEIPDIGLGDALINMKQLENLELIMFVIAESLGLVLSQLDTLKSLVVWPDTSTYSAALVNSSTLEVVSRLFLLEKLEWGILATKNASIILDSNENNETPMNNSTEWIPLLPSGTPLDSAEISPDIHPEYIGVRQFTKKLSDILSNTQIKVFSTSMQTAHESVEKEMDR